MRIGCAIDLHAARSAAAEVRWERVREQCLTAEEVGFDIVLLPDHLLYVAGGDGGYATPDEPVGVWEAIAMAGAVAEATSTIDLGHSMINTPYRQPSIVAHVASTLDAVTGGRYQLGLASGNSFDYHQLGIAADSRAGRLAEAAEIIHGLLKEHRSTVAGDFWRTDGAELVLTGPRSSGPPIVIAARGRRAMEVAVRYGDSWNGEAAADPAHAALQEALAAVDRVCADLGRDPGSLGRTVDTHVDVLDLYGMRDTTVEALGTLADLGIDEARCYLISDGTHASRLDGIRAMADVLDRQS